MNKKISIIAISFTALMLAAGSWPRLPSGESGGPSGLPSSVGQLVAETQTREQETRAASFQPPVYKPPKGIGAPGGRVGAGSRGHDAVVLFALVPDHLGLTINAQPTLFWYLSVPVAHPLVLTINNEQQVKPILETILQPSPKAGIHSVPLKALGIVLELDAEYRWFVSLTVAPDSQSKDILAGGRIQRISPSEELTKKLQGAKPEHLTGIYSEAGLWYDALASISDLCESSPKDNQFCAGQRDLLIQIDLPFDLMEIARAEENVTVPEGPRH